MARKVKFKKNAAPVKTDTALPDKSHEAGVVGTKVPVIEHAPYKIELDPIQVFRDLLENPNIRPMITPDTLLAIDGTDPAIASDWYTGFLFGHWDSDEKLFHVPETTWIAPKAYSHSDAKLEAILPLGHNFDSERVRGKKLTCVVMQLRVVRVKNDGDE